MTLDDRNAIDALALRLGNFAAIARLLTEIDLSRENAALAHALEGLADVIGEVGDRLNELTDAHCRLRPQATA